MNPELPLTLQKSFEEYVHTVEGVEFWYARDLQKLQNKVKSEEKIIAEASKRKRQQRLE